jgi:hypothetical protein
MVTGMFFSASHFARHEVSVIAGGEDQSTVQIRNRFSLLTVALEKLPTGGNTGDNGHANS